MSFYFRGKSLFFKKFAGKGATFCLPHSHTCAHIFHLSNIYGSAKRRKMKMYRTSLPSYFVCSTCAFFKIRAYQDAFQGTHYILYECDRTLAKQKGFFWLSQREPQQFFVSKVCESRSYNCFIRFLRCIRAP